MALNGLGKPHAGRQVIAVLFLAVVLYRVLTQKEYHVHEHGVVVITGCSSGIGRHAAVELARAGYVVFAGVRSEKDVVSLKGEDVPFGEYLRPVILDVTDPKTIDAAFSVVQSYLVASGESFVGIVNNAGITAPIPLELANLEIARKVFDVNVFGTVEFTRKFLPLLRASKGRIVNIGSVAGFVTVPLSGIYSASKFALEALTDSLRRELEPFGISVSLVDPAYVKTHIAEKNLGENVAWKNSPPEEQALYRHYLDSYHETRVRSFKDAPSPQVTTEAIVHALTSPTPQTRYFVASGRGFSAGMLRVMKSLLPDRVFDFMLEKTTHAVPPKNQ